MQLDIFSTGIVEPTTREQRIVARALRDCLSKDLAPWWREIGRTKWVTEKAGRVSLFSNHTPDFDRHLEAVVIDLYGHASTYRIGNWCIGLEPYDDQACVSRRFEGWDNAWSTQCLTDPSHITWCKRRRMWLPVKREAA